MTTTATPTDRIIIVSGQEFRVPLDVDLEQVRAHLSATFPDVATATVQKGKKTIDGAQYETVEFIKKAGTKGLSSADLSAVLDGLPALPIPRPVRAEDLNVLALVHQRKLTIAEALDRDVVVNLVRLPVSDSVTSRGANLCSQLDSLPPVAARRSSAW